MDTYNKWKNIMSEDRLFLNGEQQIEQSMKDTPKVSIIIPVYKVEEYLPACLDSVLSQTYTDFEAICVNDGSPDKCGQILSEYAEKDKRIKIITQENQGLSAARNVALAQAQGDYICSVDPDDELASTFLEKMCHVLDHNDVDIVSCSVQIGAKRKDWKESDPNPQLFSHPFEEYMQGKLHVYTSFWGKLYKKEVIKDLKFRLENSQGGEDILFLYQTLYLAKNVMTIEEELYFYCIRPGSTITSKLSERFVVGNIKTAEFLAEYFQDKDLSAKTRKILNQKIAKRIFKFAILEPKRKDKENLTKWYDFTYPILTKLKEEGIYQPRYLSLKNRLKSWMFLKWKM